MTGHPLNPLLLLVLAMPLILSASSIWTAWRMRQVQRRRGRRAVEHLLASRGETLVDLRELKVSTLPTTTGLSSTLAFEVTARTPGGAERTYEWAYEPRVFPWQTEGLKRLAHGIWIPAA